MPDGAVGEGPSSFFGHFPLSVDAAATLPDEITTCAPSMFLSLSTALSLPEREVSALDLMNGVLGFLAAWLSEL